MRNSFLALGLLLFLAGCGVDWFPAVTPSPSATETVTASAGGPYPSVVASSAGNLRSITLTGTGSSSNGSAVTYGWSVTSANASTATFGTPSNASTTFSATAGGTYTVQLKVTSSTGKSAVSTVQINVTAQTISAFAGGDRTQNGLDPLTLTGTGSSTTGAAVNFEWTVLAKPNAAVVTFGTPTEPTTTFLGDTVGTYTVQLKVSSGADASQFSLSTAVITVQDFSSTETINASIANASPITVNGIGAANGITLNGTVDSTLGQQNLPTATWTVTSANSASGHFVPPSAAITTFYADAAGTYTVQLTATSTTDRTKTQTATATITVIDDTALGKKGSYFPMTPTAPKSGQLRTWTYRFINSQTTDEVAVVNDTTLAHTVTINQAITRSSSSFNVSAAGVFLTAITSDSTEIPTSSYSLPGLPIFPQNTTPGTTESTIYKADISGQTHTATLTVVAVETVTLTGFTPPRTFTNALHIKGSIPGALGETNLQADAWYVPGVGLIKDTDKELTAFTE